MRDTLAAASGTSTLFSTSTVGNRTVLMALTPRTTFFPPSSSLSGGALFFRRPNARKMIARYQPSPENCNCNGGGMAASRVGRGGGRKHEERNNNNNNNNKTPND